MSRSGYDGRRGRAGWRLRCVILATLVISPALSLAISLATSLTNSMGAVARADEATYRLTVDNTWSETTHPGAFPADAHFSWLGGGTHSDAVSFWDEGSFASPGIVQMAETGGTSILAYEVEGAIVGGTAGSILNWQHWFCPDGTNHSSCGALVVEFTIDADFPLVTLVTMLGPSPDWFVGISGLALHDGTGWLDTVVVDLHPYDGGTRSQNLFELFGPQTIPPEPISLITTASGQLVGPDSLGTFTFERLGDDFVRGDANDDGALDLSDVIATLASLFGGAGSLPCRDAGDANDDGGLDISDAVHSLAHLFGGGPAPPAPYPGCGPDPSPDGLDCSAFTGCP